MGAKGLGGPGGGHRGSEQQLGIICQGGHGRGHETIERHRSHSATLILDIFVPQGLFCTSKLWQSLYQGQEKRDAINLPPSDEEWLKLSGRKDNKKSNHSLVLIHTPLPLMYPKRKYWRHHFGGEEDHNLTQRRRSCQGLVKYLILPYRFDEDHADRIWAGKSITVTKISERHTHFET